MLMKYFIFGSKYRKEIPTLYSFKITFLLDSILNVKMLHQNKLNIQTQKWPFLTKLP